MNWLLIALGAIPTLILSLAGHSLYMDWVVEPGQRHALEAQSKQLTEQCANDKAITEEASHAYQDRLTALSTQLNTIKLRRPSRCVIATPKPPTGPYAPSKHGEHGVNDGLSTDFLYDFAGEAERYRLQVIGLQGFVRKVWGR